MTTAVYIYIVYTVLSIAMTVWVASTLYKNGRVFLLKPSRAKTKWPTASTTCSWWASTS